MRRSFVVGPLFLLFSAVMTTANLPDTPQPQMNAVSAVPSSFRTSWPESDGKVGQEMDRRSRHYT
jgi:hypothetical protein